MTRRIRSHKGGRTARAPEARMTPQERDRLDAVLAHYGMKYVDWHIGHVNADYAEITGGNEMCEYCNTTEGGVHAIGCPNDDREPVTIVQRGTIGEDVPTLPHRWYFTAYGSSEWVTTITALL